MEAPEPSPFFNPGPCVLLEEAINWIAFGEYNDPAFGPHPIWSFAKDPPDEIFSYEVSRWEGRRDLALELLMARAAEGKLRVLGRRAIPQDDESLGKPENLHTQIPTVFLADCEWDVGDDMLVGPNESWAVPIVVESDLQQQFPSMGESAKPETDASPSPHRGVESISVTALPDHSRRLSIRARRPSAGGRPRKWDWPSFIQQMATRAHEGLPEKQAGFEAEMAEWCVANWGDQPAPSQIRERVSLIYALDRERRKLEPPAEISE
jgi:hypothetical protein